MVDLTVYHLTDCGVFGPPLRILYHCYFLFSVFVAYFSNALYFPKPLPEIAKLILVSKISFKGVTSCIHGADVALSALTIPTF